MHAGYSVEWLIIDPTYAILRGNNPYNPRTSGFMSRFNSLKDLASKMETAKLKLLEVETALSVNDFKLLLENFNSAFNTQSKVIGIMSSYIVYIEMLKANPQETPTFLKLNEFELKLKELDLQTR